MRVMVPARREEAFTLVELIVAMVLGVIVLALLVGAIIDMFGESERSAAKSKAEQASVAASEMLTSDLRAMRAPEREPYYTGGADNLRNLLLFQVNPSGLLVHDLLVATPTRITFYAELVNSSAGAECVNWAVQADGSMRRTVSSFTRGCGGGRILQDTQVMPTPERARASAAAAIPNPFSFRLLAHPARTNPVRPNACTTPTRANLATTLERDQVTGVELDLRSFVAGKVGRGDQELITAVSISSRQSQEYRFAIGCAA